METGSSVDFLRLTTAWYRTILSCCLCEVSYIPSFDYGILKFVKELQCVHV